LYGGRWGRIQSFPSRSQKGQSQTPRPPLRETGGPITFSATYSRKVISGSPARKLGEVNLISSKLVFVVFTEVIKETRKLLIKSI
jgi:hypothetical protein